MMQLSIVEPKQRIENPAPLAGQQIGISKGSVAKYLMTVSLKAIFYHKGWRNRFEVPLPKVNQSYPQKLWITLWISCIKPVLKARFFSVLVKLCQY
jgi:hypothetical protein